MKWVYSVIFLDKRFVMVYNLKRKGWEMPGGRVEEGENPADAAVREAYRVQGTKVQFDYAAVSLEELKKTINPTDAELQNFFKQNAAKYAKAIPETRKIEYAAFDASKTPGGKATVSDAEATESAELLS